MTDTHAVGIVMLAALVGLGVVLVVSVAGWWAVVGWLAVSVVALAACWWLAGRM